MCSGFKRELFAYTLNYTSGLIDALVAARDPEVDPYATMLEELISKHTEGPFNDYRVLAPETEKNIILFLIFSCLATSPRDRDKCPP